MKRYLYWYFWFIKESFSFMRGYNKAYILINSIQKGFRYAKDMCKWECLNTSQREAWYLSGHGRMM